MRFTLPIQEPLLLGVREKIGMIGVDDLRKKSHLGRCVYEKGRLDSARAIRHEGTENGIRLTVFGATRGRDVPGVWRESDKIIENP